jgi:Uma2 family endonuclease
MVAEAKDQSPYTYADVLGWADDVRAEIIDGELYMMADPSTTHEIIKRELYIPLCNFLRGKPCQAFDAPFGVRPFAKRDNSDNTHVEPDITVICDESKISERGCYGAPDLIIEILSPSTARVDLMVKFDLYQRIGVREYWIVDPERRLVHVHHLTNGAYTTTTYDETGAVAVHVLPGCVINLNEVFPAPSTP